MREWTLRIPARVVPVLLCVVALVWASPSAPAQEHREEAREREEEAHPPAREPAERLSEPEETSGPTGEDGDRRAVATPVVYGDNGDGNRFSGAPTLLDIQLTADPLGLVIPFDTPFTLTGKAGAKLKAISGRYCDVTHLDPTRKGRRARRRAVFSTRLLEEYPNIGDPEPLDECYGGLKPTPIAGWRRTAVTGDNFVIGVREPLEANHRYLFQFTLKTAVPDETITGFREKALVALDAAYRDFAANRKKRRDSPESFLDYDEYGVLLQRLRNVVNDLPLVPGAKVQFGGADLFAEPPVLTETWKRRFDEILSTHGHRAKALGTFENARTKRVEVLESLRRAGYLDSIIGDLGVLQRRNKDLFAALVDVDAWNTLEWIAGSRRGDPEKSILGEMAIGQSSPQETVRLEEAWKTADLKPRIDNLDASVEKLRAADSYLRLALRDGSLARFVDQQALLDLLGGVSEAFEAIDAARKDMNAYHSAIDRRMGRIKALVEDLEFKVREDVTIGASTAGDFDARAKTHISVDLGVAYARKIEEMLPYIGTNFYLRPVNRDVSLRDRDSFLRRFSLQLGLTVSSIQQRNSAGTVLRDDLFGDSGVLLGAGYRVTDYLRVSVGSLWFRERDTNPLVEDMDIATDFFVGFGFDWNIKSSLGKFGKLFD